MVAARGPHGGYRLSRKRLETRISDIIAAVEEPIKATRCRSDSEKGCLGKTGRCLTHDLWEELGHRIEAFLESVTLADVLEQRVRSRPRRAVSSRVAAGAGRMIYLDHNATSPLRPSAKAAMLAALDECGNASSVHAAGRKARARVEARATGSRGSPMPIRPP